VEQAGPHRVRSLKVNEVFIYDVRSAVIVLQKAHLSAIYDYMARHRQFNGALKNASVRSRRAAISRALKCLRFRHLVEQVGVGRGRHSHWVPFALGTVPRSMNMTEHTDPPPKTPVEIAKEWLFYAQRFGILAEVYNGVYSNEQLEAMARAVIELTEERDRLLKALDLLSEAVVKLRDDFAIRQSPLEDL
jgi:hypothetical protein